MLGIPIGITRFAIGLNICTKVAGIKKYKPIITKNKNKLDKIVLFAKFKLNGIEVLISKILIDANISHDEFVLMNNVVKEYDNIKKEMKTLKT